MAARFGDQARQVVAHARARAQQQEHEPEQKTRAKEAVTFARDSIFEREAVVDERMILRDALRRGMGETSFRDIRAEFDERRQAGQFRLVLGMKHDSGRSFTTPETIVRSRRRDQTPGSFGTTKRSRTAHGSGGLLPWARSRNTVPRLSHKGRRSSSPKTQL